VSRRRHDRSPRAHSPTAATTEDFSAEELDFFKRGDELHPPASEPGDTPDSDA
jgi:hypothetical protein